MLTAESACAAPRAAIAGDWRPSESALPVPCRLLFRNSGRKVAKQQILEPMRLGAAIHRFELYSLLDARPVEHAREIPEVVRGVLTGIDGNHEAATPLKQ